MTTPDLNDHAVQVHLIDCVARVSDLVQQAEQWRNNANEELLQWDGVESTLACPAALGYIRSETYHRAVLAFAREAKQITSVHTTNRDQANAWVAAMRAYVAMELAWSGLVETGRVDPKDRRP